MSDLPTDESSSEERDVSEREPSPEPEAEEGSGDEPEGQARAPWHFKVIVVGSVVYLGYRLYQGITWLAHHV